MVIAYLSFCGDCEEALTLYTGVFGGEITSLSRFTEQTGGRKLAGKVMHAEAVVAGGVLAAGDGGDPEKLARREEPIRLMVHCASRAEAQGYFDALAKEGQPLQRLAPHPPPDDGGMGALVRDKFGYEWILTAPNDHRG